jgi:cardiolipin synthase
MLLPADTLALDVAPGEAAVAPSLVSAWPSGLRLAATGPAAFAHLMRRIREARRTVDVRAYIWRNDETGRGVARALIEAADRGVQVRIAKDRDAASYEYYEGAGQSLFHPRMSLYDKIEASFLRVAYDGELVWRSQRPDPVARALLAHPGIQVRHEEPRYDHAKVFVFDDERLFFGGMCIGDDAHHQALDFMLEIEGEERVDRYRLRRNGHAPFDATRQLDFLLHTRAVHGVGPCPMRDDRLAAIEGARRSLAIEMAYFGDRGFSDALVRAVRRGVRTTLIAGRRATILRDLNLRELEYVRRESGAPDHLRIVLHPAEVHSKVVVVDEEVVDLGSANFTPLSHGVYDELDVHVRDRAFAQGVSGVLEQHAGEGEHLRGRVHHDRVKAAIEHWLMMRHGRGAGLRQSPGPR